MMINFDESVIDEKIQNIGDRICGLRRRRGLTQIELAQQVGLKSSGFSDIESGRNNPTNQLIIKLSDIFNVSTDYLLTGHQLVDKTNTWGTISKDEEQILDMYRNDQQVKKVLTEVLKSKKKMIKSLTKQNA
jgi:transcriptional regulator with XRE-family HTH domain